MITKKENMRFIILLLAISTLYSQEKYEAITSGSFEQSKIVNSKISMTKSVGSASGPCTPYMDWHTNLTTKGVAYCIGVSGIWSQEIILSLAATAITTLPDATGITNSIRRVICLSTAAGTCTVNTTGSQTIISATGSATTFNLAAGTTAVLMADYGSLTHPVNSAAGWLRLADNQ